MATHLSQPAPHAVGEQPANVVYVHVGKHHVGHGCEIDAGGLQVPDFIALRGDPSDKLPGASGVGATGAATLLQRMAPLKQRWLPVAFPHRLMTCGFSGRSQQ